MIIDATIKVINGVKNGTHRATGMEWRSQRITVGWEAEALDGSKAREDLMIVRLRENDIERFAAEGFKQYDKVRMQVSFYPVRHGDWYDNDVVLVNWQRYEPTEG